MGQLSSSASSPAAVAIATCAAVAGVEKDDLQLIEALHQRGIKAVHAAWDDPTVDWSFSLVVIRSTWDYPERREEFLAWASRLQRVLNPLPILAWNTDKHYLNDLAEARLPVIPTLYVEPDDNFAPPSFPYVVKPAVSCSAKDSAWYPTNQDAQALGHVRQLQEQGRSVMIQPYLADIERKGEVALMFLGGTYSHSICRDALLKEPGSPGQGASQPLNVRPYEATPAERSLAERVMAHLPVNAANLLYGRVDLVPGPQGELLILEVELTEPSLFLSFRQGSVERLADAIAHVLAGS